MSSPVQATSITSTVTNKPHPYQFDDIVGQDQAKRALLVAAAGHHNSLLNGPPGTGKSMLARALPSIMPDLTNHELLEVTHMHSLTSKNFDQLTTQRPFRAPHHSASAVSILGGGQYPRPGEISLSHHGVLLLDEFPEFDRKVIESLRQPLEDHTISIARPRDTIEFPAHFLMVATANPCPCGFYGSAQPCICTPLQVLYYQKKISGPILDRIDLYITVETVPHHQLLTVRENLLPRTDLKGLVTAVRRLQRRRAGKLNSELSNNELKQFAHLERDAKVLLDQAATRVQLSARGYIRVIRVARTIADLEDSPSIRFNHISEALQYRPRADA